MLSVAATWAQHEGVYAEYVEPAIEVREDAHGQGYIERQ